MSARLFVLCVSQRFRDERPDRLLRKKTHDRFRKDPVEDSVFDKARARDDDDLELVQVEMPEHGVVDLPVVPPHRLVGPRGLRAPLPLPRHGDLYPLFDDRRVLPDHADGRLAPLAAHDGPDLCAPDRIGRLADTVHVDRVPTAGSLGDGKVAARFQVEGVVGAHLDMR